MAEIIRKIETEDFDEVSKLFGGQKGNSAKELMWLFLNPNDPNDYNAFVVVNDNKTILGVIAYEENDYIENDKKIIGISGNSWMLRTDYKGMAGITLFKKVSQLGDLGISVGGAEVSQKLYPMFKYYFCFDSHYYYKILKPFRYFRILKRTSFIKKAGMFVFLLPSYFKGASKSTIDKNVSLVPYNNNFVEDKVYQNVFRKRITKNYIEWLLKCPSFKTAGFVIKNGTESIGVCVLYMQRIGNTYKGRIAHMPFLGPDEKLWESVIKKCSIFLKEQGCCFFSALAVNDHYKNGLLKSGFVAIKNHKELVYIKDTQKKIEAFNTNNWHLQFSDGDIALRNF